MKPKEHWQYFYHFFVIILCIVNSVFLIVNIHNWQINIDSGSLILTFIGFMLAFSAINTYSTFNAYIDTEKKRINELADEFEIQLRKDRKQIGFTRDVVRFQMLINSISASKSLNPQFVEWINMASNLAKSLLESLCDINESFSKDTFEWFYSDAIMNIRLGRYLLDSKLKDMQDDLFWGEKGVYIKPTVEEAINNLIQEMDNLDNYDFSTGRPYPQLPREIKPIASSRRGFKKRIEKLFKRKSKES